MLTKKIGVIGSGLMGSGIALQNALSGYEVVNFDMNEAALVKSEENLKKLLEKKVTKESLSEEEKNNILNRLSFSSDFKKLAEIDLIFEAVPERMDIKKSVIYTVNNYVTEDVLFLSNTSGLSISEMASEYSFPENLLGVHFFYPAPVMKLVEIIKSEYTSDETYQEVKDFIETINKTSVLAPELPGFIVNRILVPMMNEAAFLVMEGCSPEDVDSAMKLGANLPMGPLELADFVGLDVMCATMNGLYDGFKDSKYRPCPLIENKVKAKKFGRKSGEGFYKY
ncbi:3-hydroxyacyl-CoA dehydrogenase family protein [Enterococcus casseliflavus]|uniref:3-hydroxyacyl-CoA dehydrogenase family protein n=1 Tax=Enterococcus casseliflavus TaxID=37734 RepID=UPI001AD74C44|nr:3-hydroxyacyl-CoA dehydrogenase family protein [Enterococcus casseliflavus]MBO6359622.1 3-hydroxyacyl-CoA dehydrogenase family protein [Enterococcus casseliflavus]MBO6377746.1 3-hydroxyacyl-CoA dehydrogenase family protein [Enterococcus casseliflavus]